METVQQKMQRFRQYNRTLISVALAKSNRRHQGVPAKLLLCSLLDSLSVAAFPDGTMRNGERFKESIKLYANFEFGDHVSLLQLLSIFDSLDSIPSEFALFHEWARSIFLQRFPITNRLLKSHVSLDKDPILPEFVQLWPKGSNGEPLKLGCFKPSDFTHSNLIWKYRNKLAHEFRNPGTGIDIKLRVNKTAYYQVVSTVSEMSHEKGLSFENRWELVYPTGFFYHLAKSVLDNLCITYQDKNTSPFLSYSESNSWLK